MEEIAYVLHSITSFNNLHIIHYNTLQMAKLMDWLWMNDWLNERMNEWIFYFVFLNAFITQRNAAGVWGHTHDVQVVLSQDDGTTVNGLSWAIEHTSWKSKNFSF